MNGTQVLTSKEAKQITRGRTPLVPVEYEQAITALAACSTLDESKYWADKADALAAWAKIYHSDEVDRKAKQLKLHAYRRMGQIAEELRPTKLGFRKGTPVKGAAAGDEGAYGPQKGANSLLVENGLKMNHAKAALRLSKVGDEKFEKILVKPTSPLSASRSLNNSIVPRDITDVKAKVSTMMNKYTPQQVALFYKGSDASGQKGYFDNVKRFAREAAEWFDELDQHLTKEIK